MRQRTPRQKRMALLAATSAVMVTSLPVAVRFINSNDPSEHLVGKVVAGICGIFLLCLAFLVARALRN